MKMLPTIWNGLSAKKSLQRLTMRMPTTRDPLPMITAPPLRNLVYFHVRDIDPLCFPDNIGEVLYHAKKLEVLKLHFSPRMRRERDPSLNLDAFFGPVKTTEYLMPLKVLALQNFFASNGGVFPDVHDLEVAEELTLLNSSAGVDGDAPLSFINHIPTKIPKFVRIKKMRGNKANVMHAKALPTMLKTVESYHLITGRPMIDAPWPATPDSKLEMPYRSFVSHVPQESPETSTPSSEDAVSSPASDVSGGNVSRSTALRNDAAMAQMFHAYYDAILGESRPLFRSMLMFPQWKWSTSQLSRLVRNCKHLEEIGLAIEPSPVDVVRYFAAHLPKLTTLRFLNAPKSSELGDSIEAVTAWYETRIGAATWNTKNTVLRWIGVGDMYFELLRGSTREIRVDGKVQMGRVVKRVPLSKVVDLPIWATDVLEI